jgi:RIO-like serine/threonine protein kinase
LNLLVRALLVNIRNNLVLISESGAPDITEVVMAEVVSLTKLLSVSSGIVHDDFSVYNSVVLS